MYVHSDVPVTDHVYLGTWDWTAVLPEEIGGGLSIPVSGTYAATNRVHFSPFTLTKPYDVKRWWWQNGATVGTNFFNTGVYDEDLNLIAASKRVLSAGTANQLQYSDLGVSGRNIINAVNNADQSSYTTASCTMRPGHMYLIAVRNAHGSSASAVNSITGTGAPTFTSRSTVTFNGGLDRVSIWSAVPTGLFTGTLTIDFNAVTQTGAGWSLNGFTGVDTATNDGVVQNATGSGAAGTTLTATLAAFGSSANATFGAGAIDTTNVLTQEANYVELSDNGFATPAGELECEYRSDNDTSVTMTTGVASDWGICAVEIKAATTLTLPPMRGYLAIHGDGTTATLFRGSNTRTSAVGAYFQSTQATGLPQAAALTTANGVVYCHGFTRRSSP